MTRTRFIKALMGCKVSKRRAEQIAKELPPGTSYSAYLETAISKALTRWYKVDWGNITPEDLEKGNIYVAPPIFDKPLTDGWSTLKLPPCFIRPVGRDCNTCPAIDCPARLSRELMLASMRVGPYSEQITGCRLAFVL